MLFTQYSHSYLQQSFVVKRFTLQEHSQSECCGVIGIQILRIARVFSISMAQEAVRLNSTAKHAVAFAGVSA